MTGCSCAACASAATTPAMPANRPGLDRIAYRAGTHSTFLGAMLGGLSLTTRPALAALRTRDPDDPTIALLDAFAVTCDVLTFYTERLANEAFLGTAVDRTSLQELGTLVGHRLGRGAAAETLLAFSLERPPVLPPREGQDPGVLPPAVPLGVSLPFGLRVRSVPGPGEKPQTFETVEQIDARPEWNALPVARTTPHPPRAGSSDAWLVGANLGIQPGDHLLFVGDTVADGWDVRPVTAVDADQSADRTHVRWQPALDAFVALPAAAVSAFRKRLSIFGHNAPIWTSMGEDFQTGYSSQRGNTPAWHRKEWEHFKAVTGPDGQVVVDVDGAHPDIVVGAHVCITHHIGDAHKVLYTVLKRQELSRSAFAVSGKITRLTLNGPSHPFGSPRDATVLAVPAGVTVIEAPDSSPMTGAAIWVEGDASAMRPGRTVLLVGRAATGPAAQTAQPLVVESAARSGSRTALAFTTAPVGVDRASAVVFGNVAKATHGETVGQLLGSGDARVPFTAARLAQDPLTFVSADTPRGTASTLRVRVDEIAWTEIPTTAIAGPRDRVFMTRDEPDGRLSVVFGDGEHGARPPTGSNNLRATYRIGSGAAGNVDADSLSTPIDRPLGLKAVTNPLPAEGGVDPETDAHARRSIPVPVRTLGRVVSLRDYADFALAFTGIGKADSTVLPLPAGATVVVTVADADGAPPADTIIERLDAELRRWGDPGSRHLVVPARAARFRIALSVTVDPARESEVVLGAVTSALRARYSVASRSIGEPAYRSALIAHAASVPGVVAIDLDRFYRGWLPTLRPRLVAVGPQAFGAVVLGAELLSLSPAPFDQFGESP